MPDKYTEAVRSVECDKPTCKAKPGQPCMYTSAVVHPIRRKRAIAEGKWDPIKAFYGEYGSLHGCPIEAVRRT